MGFEVVRETEFGVYVWQVPDGRIVGDEHGNWLSISAREGDIKRVQELQEAARACGVEEGKALFLPGHRKVDDEEYEKQKARLELGLIPDEYDAGAWAEEIKAKNAGY